MKYPEFLQKGQTIGLIAPSFGANIEPYATGLTVAEKKLKESGYNYVEGPNARRGDGVGISAPPADTGAELTEYYCNDSCDVIISCGGGELMCETMDHIDVEALKKANPKWYMGYSDNTNFTLFLNTWLDTASIYGPCIASFAMEPPHETQLQSLALLTGQNLTVHGYDTWEKESLKGEDNPAVPYNLTETKALRTFLGEKETTNENVSIEGRLIGGCQDILFMTAGTSLDKVPEFVERYKDDGIIWFLEACEMNVMDIKRSLWTLEHAGWFKYVKGFIIGRPMMAMEQDFLGLDHYKAVTGILGKYNVPIIMDADIGHLSPMMPLVSGAYAKVTVQKGEIYVEHQFK